MSKKKKTKQTNKQTLYSDPDSKIFFPHVRFMCSSSSLRSFLRQNICPFPNTSSIHPLFLVLQLPLVMSVTMLLTMILWRWYWSGCLLALQTAVVWMKEGQEGTPTWEVKGFLLSGQPFKSHPGHVNNLLNAFHQVLGDITASHKTVVTFTFLLTPFSALHHWLPLLAHSVFQHKVNWAFPPEYISSGSSVYLLMD